MIRKDNGKTQRVNMSVTAIGLGLILPLIITLCSCSAPTRTHKSFVKVYKYDNPKDNPNNLNIWMPDKPIHYKHAVKCYYPK